MGHFHAIPDAVAVAADRLVAVVRVSNDGGVVVRDLANGELSTISASELSAPPALSDPAIAPVLSLVQATDAQWQRARRREAVIAELVNANDLVNQVTRASAGLVSPAVLSSGGLPSSATHHRHLRCWHARAARRPARAASIRTLSTSSQKSSETCTSPR
jgi:hypothetical protein